MPILPKSRLSLDCTMPYTYRPLSVLSAGTAAGASPDLARSPLFDLEILRGLARVLVVIDLPWARAETRYSRSIRPILALDSLDARNRENNLEDCTFSNTAPYLDSAAVALHNSLDNPQS